MGYPVQEFANRSTGYEAGENFFITVKVFMSQFNSFSRVIERARKPQASVNLFVKPEKRRFYNDWSVGR
jgi:hypothetical protein